MRSLSAGEQWTRILKGFFTNKQGVMLSCRIRQFPCECDERHIYQIERIENRGDKQLTWFCDAVVFVPDQRVIQIGMYPCLF